MAPTCSPATGAAPRGGRSREVAAETGLVVEDVETGWCGAVVRVEKAGGMHVVHLEDRRGRTKGFPLGPGFLLDGAPVDPDRPHGARPGARLAAGPRGRRRARPAGRGAVHGAAGHGSPAARGSSSRAATTPSSSRRCGAHDLRVEGVVVEMLDGVDDLAAAIRDFAPGPGSADGGARRPPRAGHQGVPRRRGGAARCQPYAAHVRSSATRTSTCGSRCVPSGSGCDAWPVIPRGQSWKHGICAHLGWPHETQADIALAWKQILGTVRSYADLEPTLLASVEELIDFVTAPVE